MYFMAHSFKELSFIELYTLVASNHPPSLPVPIDFPPKTIKI